MRYLLTLLLLTVGGMAQSFSPHDPFFSTVPPLRLSVIIDNTGSTNTLTNYQVKVPVTYQPYMLPDFADVRFYGLSGRTVLPFWLESWTNSVSATFWIKVPSIPAATKITNYLRYGWARATTRSSGDTTFDLFDTFGGRAWTKLADMPGAMQEHGSDTIGNTIYTVVGGDTSSGFSTHLYAYDALLKSWSSKAAVPLSLQSPIVRAVGGYLYCIAGLWATAAKPTNTCFRYDPTNNSWATMSAMPVPMEDFGSAVISNRYIYTLGGWDATNISSGIRIYDTTLDSWSTSTNTLPVPTCLGDFACAVSNKIYIASANTNMASYPTISGSKRTFVLDIATDTWTELANTVLTTSYKELEPIGGSIYTACGAVGPALTTDTYLAFRYDIVGNTWNYIEFLPFGASGASLGVAMASWNGNVFMSGGDVGGTAVANTTNSFWMFDAGLDVSATPNASVWTVDLKGSASSTAETRQGVAHLSGFGTTLSSGNITSLATFTNGFSLECSRRYPSSTVNYYTVLGFGSGALAPSDSTTTNWFLTLKRSGYAAAIINSTAASIRKMPASGANSVIGTSFSPTDTNGYAYARTVLTYDKAGVIKWLVNGTQKDTATDTDFLNDAKSIHVSQGRYSTANFGGDSYYEWIFVRKLNYAEPTVTVQ